MKKKTRMKPLNKLIDYRTVKLNSISKFLGKVNNLDSIVHYCVPNNNDKTPRECKQAVLN